MRLGPARASIPGSALSNSCRSPRPTRTSSTTRPLQSPRSSSIAGASAGRKSSLATPRPQLEPAKPRLRLEASRTSPRPAARPVARARPSEELCCSSELMPVVLELLPPKAISPRNSCDAQAIAEPESSTPIRTCSQQSVGSSPCAATETTCSKLSARRVECKNLEAGHGVVLRPHAVNSTSETPSVSSTASTRTPSPHSQFAALATSPIAVECLTDQASSNLVQRLLKAEQSLLEKDRRIEALEAQLRGLARPNTDASEYATDEDLDALCHKSQILVQRMAALDGQSEPEQQWKALMTAHEDCKDRLGQIESLVQRRADQLSSGDAELKLCRAVRGLCVGAQRTAPRRWALSS